MRSVLNVALTVALLGLWASPLAAAVFSETFDGPGLPSTLTYSSSPNLAWSINGSQQLFADYDGSNVSVTATAITKNGFIAPAGLSTVYSLDVGAPTGIGTGAYNVGMLFGGYGVLFHPGLSGGTLRIDGGYSLSNTNMGFTPALGVLHHIEAKTTMTTGGLAVDMTITGLGTDALMHTFNHSFLDTTPNLNTGTFGGRRSGPGNNVLNDAFFDNYRVEYVPEPSSIAMLLLGLTGIIALRRRKRRV